mgnify:FL=1
MNRWGLMSALALAAALLLAGCGGDYGLSDDDSADEPQITLEQIRAANDPRSLLEKHGAVTVTVQESDQNDAVTYTAKFQYTRGVEDVLAWYHCRYTENSTSGKSELWSEANGTMDAARMESDSTEDLSLSIYLEGKYEQYVLDMIPRCPALEEDVEQTVDSCSEQDGELLLSVTARYLASDGDYYTVHYRVDPATNEVLEASVTDYIKKESGEVSKLHTTRYRWSYDEPYQAGRNLLNEVLFSTDSKEDVCDLTTFYPVEEENGWAMTLYRVAHGTRILFLDSVDLAFYADRELTEPIDFYDGVDTSGESATVYIVPLEENH